jgi:hypothetical protein
MFFSTVFICDCPGFVFIIVTEWPCLTLMFREVISVRRRTPKPQGWSTQIQVIRDCLFSFAVTLSLSLKSKNHRTVELERTLEIS